MPLKSIPKTTTSRKPTGSARRRRAKVLVTLGAGTLMAAGVAAGPAFAASPNSQAEPQKVTICHATGSDTNPFVQITVADESIFEAHSEHQNMRDIVPAFTFVNSKGETMSFAGLNLTATGMSLLANGCVAAAGPTPAVQPPTPTPMPSSAPMGAAAAQAGSGVGMGAAAGPAEVTIAAQTGVGMPAADYTVPASLLGSGLLTLGWALASLRRRPIRPSRR